MGGGLAFTCILRLFEMLVRSFIFFPWQMGKDSDIGCCLVLSGHEMSTFWIQKEWRSRRTHGKYATERLNVSNTKKVKLF